MLYLRVKLQMNRLYLPKSVMKVGWKQLKLVVYRSESNFYSAFYLLSIFIITYFPF